MTVVLSRTKKRKAAYPKIRKNLGYAAFAFELSFRNTLFRFLKQQAEKVTDFFASHL